MVRLGLVALAAFGAGLLAGLLATASGRQGPRAPARDEAVAPAALSGGDGTREAPIGVGGRADPGPHDRGVAVRTGESPDEDQPLEGGADFDKWDGAELARWYAVHRKAWDLPDLDEALLTRRGHLLLGLERIPRREVLLRVLAALEEWDASVGRVAEESSAWHAANPGAACDDPAALLWRERLRDVHQRWFDRLHRELAYSDYLLLLAGADQYGDVTEVTVRPPPGGALRGGDPYARPVWIAGAYDRFERWYRAYRHDLGLPDRDAEFLCMFHQHVVVPLGRLPEPPLMRALQEAYLAVCPRLRDGIDWDATVRDLFVRLDRILTPLDYERMRYSHEWDRTVRALAIPGPTER